MQIYQITKIVNFHNYQVVLIWDELLIAGYAVECNFLAKSVSYTLPNIS